MIFIFKQKSIKMVKRKWIVIAIGLLILLFLFIFFGKEKIMPEKDTQSESETLMDAYEIGGESIPSLSEVLAEGETADLTSEEVAADSEGSGSNEKYIFHYNGLTSGGQTAEKYVALVTAEDIGFQVVDEEGKAAKVPDFTAEEGSVNLEKTASEEGKLLKIEAAWTTQKCDVTISRPTGTITEEEAEAITVSEAISYLESLSPSALGLEGDSMSEYKVYVLEGKVMVNGVLCIQLDIYKKHQPDGSNAIVGSYMITEDKCHIYCKRDGNSAVEMNTPSE